MNNGRAKNVGIGSKWLKFLKHWSFKVVNSVTFTQWINRFAIFVLNLHSFLSFVGKISIIEKTVYNFGMKYIMSTRGRRGGGGRVVIPPEADCLDILPKNIHRNSFAENITYWLLRYWVSPKLAQIVRLLETHLVYSKIRHQM